MSSLSKIEVVNGMRQQNSIEQLGPRNSPASVRIRVDLEARRGNVHACETPRQKRHVGFRVPDQRRPFRAQTQPLLKISIQRKLWPRANQPNTSPPKRTRIKTKRIAQVALPA